ncbi:MAG: hypothetical protein HND47_07120 [Chloroflexi bacterium]|nr:hypothetical protein [Chloroflexota bacterium]
MKDENAENLENQPGQASSDDLKKKPAGAQKDQKDLEGVHLPLLVEFAYTVSILGLLFLGLTIAVTSFLTGAGLLTVIVRTGAAMAVMGGLLMSIAAQISSGMLFAQKAGQAEQSSVAEVPSRIETQDGSGAS